MVTKASLKLSLHNLDLDSLEICGLKIDGIHGILHDEKLKPQTFEISGCLLGNLKRPAQSDNLQDTVDYSYLCDIARQIIGGPSKNLLETLAFEIAQNIALYIAELSCHIWQVQITVEKVSPPVANLRAAKATILVPVSRKAYLGLGSNLGDRWSFIRHAVQSLKGVVAVSPVYETEPIGGPDGQDPYLNLVIAVETAETPFELLNTVRKIEEDAKRERKQRWGARTLDIDILTIGNLQVNSPNLEVPHPRMFDRKFVLVPLRDLNPELISDKMINFAIGDVTCVGTI